MRSPAASIASRRAFCAAIVVATLAASASLPAARAEPQEVSARMRAARDDLVARLVELGQWCVGARILGTRDRLAAEILVIDADQPVARSWLRYRRGPSGAWTQDPAYRAPSDITHSTQLPEFRRRRAEIGAAHAETMLALLEEAGDALPLRARELALGKLLVVAPDDEKARAAHGEVREGDRWLLAETPSSRARRKELAGAATQALAAAGEPRAARPSSDDLTIVPSPNVTLELGTLRIVSERPAAEAELALRRSIAASSFFSNAFNEESPGPGNYTYYLFASRSDGQMAIRRLPLSLTHRDFALKLSMYWIPDFPQNLIYADNPTTRAEFAPRVSNQQILRRAFGVKESHGALSEGFGTYLTWRVTKTHKTFLCNLGAYAEDAAALDISRRLRDTDEDWLDVGRSLLEAKKSPDLRLLLGKSLNDLRPEDMVFAHALATYLVEGRPADAAAFCRAVVEGPLDEATAASIRATPEGLEERLIRWLLETAPGRPPVPPAPGGKPPPATK